MAIPIKELNDLKGLTRLSYITNKIDGAKGYQTYKILELPNLAEGNNAIAIIQPIEKPNSSGIAVNVGQLLDGCWYVGAG
jgi:hypothetical protein